MPANDGRPTRTRPATRPAEPARGSGGRPRGDGDRRGGRSHGYGDDREAWTGNQRPESREAPRRRSSGGSRPVVRGAHVKVPHDVARLLRAGHPWVFRSAVQRPLAAAEGTAVPVMDEEGYLVGHGLYEPEGAIAVRMLSLAPEFAWNEQEMLARVQAAVRRRGPVAAQTACRLIHAEADGLPGLAVDRLGDFLLVYKYAKVAESYVDALVPLLEQELKPAGIYLQDRIRGVTADERRPPAFHLAGKPAPPELEVNEDGLKFLVDVTAPVSPGLFLDLREGRRMCESLAKDRTVCNLFSFTGAFGLRALRGGGRSVTNVDAAARSHQRCRQNLSASGMDPEAIEAITGDVFALLEKFRQRGRVFDLVIADPPPFSNVKGSTFSALKDYGDLMAAVAGIVSPGGLVLAISNAVRLTEEEFLLACGEGVYAAGRTARLVGECGLPPDFPVLPAFIEGRYLKVKLFRFD